MNKTADTLPEFQTDYMFIRTVAESTTQPCITFVETRSGVVISFMCARKSGYEDLTKHFEAYGFLNPVIIQCDKEMSTIDVCRKVARERNARTALRFAPKTSHQSKGFIEAVHGHVQGLARCYQTQIETNTGVQLSAISPAIPFAIRHAGFVLSRFTVRPDGRTPFQYLLGTPFVSPLCMFGESVFALIPDHEVACSQTDEQVDQWFHGGDEMHRPTNTWWRRNMICLSADQFAENHLKGNGVDVNRSKFEARSGILTWKWILEYPDQLWNHVEMWECRQQRHQWKFLQYLHLHLRQKNTYSRCKFAATAEEAMWRPRRGW